MWLDMPYNQATIVKALATIVHHHSFVGNLTHLGPDFIWCIVTAYTQMLMHQAIAIQNIDQDIDVSNRRNDMLIFIEDILTMHNVEEQNTIQLL